MIIKGTHLTQVKSVGIKQNGVALLTILLIVVVISVLATAMLAKQNKMVQQTSLLLNQDNMLNAALAGEAHAIALLDKDAKVNKTDSLQDIWAKENNELKLPNVKVVYNIQDISGAYNLNNLQTSGKMIDYEKAFFERLLLQVGLEKTLVSAIKDWQDNDSYVTGEEGAEADWYAAKKITPANQSFHSTQELIKVKGIGANGVQALKPYIITVPRYTTININTASFVVLSALADDLDSSEILKWVEGRKKAKAFEKVSDLFNQPPFARLTEKQQKTITPLLSVEANVFKVKISVSQDDTTKHLTSYIFKKDGVFTVFERDFGNFAN